MRKKLGGVKLRIHTKLIALTAAILFLAGCATSSPGFEPNSESNSVASAVKLSEKWDSEGTGASGVIGDLIAAGICDRAATVDDGVFWEDALAQVEADEFGICYNWADGVDPTSFACGTTFYVSTGAAMAGYDPKRSLYYEDGASVALFYGYNYEVELAPVNGGYLSGQEMLDTCSSLVALATSEIGGSKTMVDQYESEFENGDAGVEEEVVETVSMPNLLGSLDGQARSWLTANGYSFSVMFKSTGFNPKTSCMMSGRNPILNQTPAPGVTVTNDYSTQVVFTVNCEW